MTRLLALPSHFNWLPAALTLSVVLSACGAGNLPGALSSSNTSGSAGNTPALGAGLSSDQATTISLLVSATPAQVSVSAQDLPGVQVQVGSAVADGQDAQVPVSVTGQVSQTTTLHLNVKVGASTRKVDLQLWPLQRFALPVNAYQASSLRAVGGQVYVLPTVNAPDPQRHTVISVDVASGAARAEVLPLADEEGFTSQAASPDGTRYLMIQNVAGNWVGAAKPGEALKKMALGTPGDNLNFLTLTPGGRLWALQYRQDALFELSVQSGAQQSHPVEDNAEDLTSDANGVLYYSRFLTNPAVIRFDPASGQTRSYPVGIKGKTRPRLLTATTQSVWFLDSWTRKLSRIDTASGTISDLNVPTGASIAALSVSADGTLWASDVARHALYRWQPGQLSAQSISVPGDGPRALEVESGGTVWFESAGALYRLRP